MIVSLVDLCSSTLSDSIWICEYHSQICQSLGDIPSVSSYVLSQVGHTLIELVPITIIEEYSMRVSQFLEGSVSHFV